MLDTSIIKSNVVAYPTITIHKREIKSYEELDRLIEALEEKRKQMRDGFLSQIRAGNREPDTINYNL